MRDLDLVRTGERNKAAVHNRPWANMLAESGLPAGGSAFPGFATKPALVQEVADREQAITSTAAAAASAASAAQAAATSTAATDATTKANAAQAAAIAVAATDASTKAALAATNAAAIAAIDATNKVAAEATARATADAFLLNVYPILAGEQGVVSKQYPALHAWRYGCTPDNGVTDNYTPLINLAASASALCSAANPTGTSTVILPPGIYYVGQYKITGGASQNAITDIVFNACVGLKVLGYGAKIDMRGNFNRAKDNGTGSYENSVSIIFRDCQRLTIEGIELDGNKDQMTKDPTVLEGANHGLYLQTCTQVDIGNVYVHHWPSDGLYIRENPFGASRLASRYVTVRDSRFVYNGRLGFGCIQLIHGTFSNCTFSYNGDTGDSYGGHGPKSGVDVEPNLWTGSASTPMDVDTGHLLFDNCRLEGNESASYHLTNAVKGVHDIVIRGGYIDTTANVTGDYCMVCDAANVLVQDVEIHTGATAAVWGTINAGTGASSRFVRCRIYTTNTAVATTGRGFNASIAGSCIVEDCDFIGQHTSPLGTYFPYIQAQSTTMRRCRISIPAAAHDGTTGASHQASMLRCNAEDVEYTTTLVPTTTQHFSPLLDMTAYRYRDIKFLSGTAFRVSSNSTWDNNRPWNHRDRAVKRGISADVGNTSKTLSATSDVEVQRWATPINAVKTCTLPAATNCYEGLRYMIVREATATGAFNLNINLNSGTLVRALTAAGTFALVEWDSTLGDFRQVGGGTF